MGNPELAAPSNQDSRGRQAAALLAKAFESAGWKARQGPEQPKSARRADLVVRRGEVAYLIEVKAASEGRSDRLVPLWAQACLQAVRAAAGRYPVLVVVAAPSVAPRVAQQVLDFAAEYAPEAAVGVIDFAGLRRFRGPHLEGLDADAAARAPLPRAMQGKSADLFSDLNQWLLKVLLAPEVPGNLLSAPRGRYQNASQLAKAANVSVMSAFRLVEQLRRQGYLDASSGYRHLVRRNDLFRRWQEAAARPVKEIPMRLLLKSDPEIELRRLLKHGVGCLALFAAAEALGVGLVRGVPPHAYVPHLSAVRPGAWKGIVPALPGESPELFFRQPAAPQSVFRGVVRPQDVPASDIIQVWLDVSSHPARGEEQGELIRRRVLDRVFQGE